MKSILPILSAALIISSCTSVYKSGQTPDDVYFSPSKPQDEYVAMDNNREGKYYSDDQTLDDEYLRMRVQNHRFYTLDDDWYSYNPSYYYSYNNSFYYSNPYYNNYHGFWNYTNYPYYNTYYNPYYTGMVVYTPTVPVYNRPRTFNLNTYNPGNQNSQHATPRVYSGRTNNNNYRGSGTNAGQFLRNVFNSGSTVNNSNSTNSSPRSTNTSNSSNNSSSSGSSGGSSGGHASVRRF